MATRKITKNAQKAAPKKTKSGAKKGLSKKKKTASKPSGRQSSRPATKKASRLLKTEAKRTVAAKQPTKPAKKSVPQVRRGTKVISAQKIKARRSTFAAGLKVYEAALQLMHANEFERAKDKFDALISQYPTEMELLARVHVLVQACQTRIAAKTQERAKLKTVDDYYEVGVGALNRHEFESATDHFQRALKLVPDADYVYYALAATFALQGDRDAALDSLKQAIQHRAENRFHALHDSDFESLSEDSVFLQLVQSDEH